MVIISLSKIKYRQKLLRVTTCAGPPEEKCQYLKSNGVGKIYERVVEFISRNTFDCVFYSSKISPLVRLRFSSIALLFCWSLVKRVTHAVEFSRFARNREARLSIPTKWTSVNGVSLHRRNSCERPSYFFHSTRIRVRHAYRVMHGMRVVIDKGVRSKANLGIRWSPLGMPRIYCTVQYRRDFEVSSLINFQINSLKFDGKKVSIKYNFPL